MKRKISKCLILVIVLFFAIQSVNIVKADDFHHYNDNYKQLKHNKYDNHYDDDWDDHDDHYEHDYDHDWDDRHYDDDYDHDWDNHHYDDDDDDWDHSYKREYGHDKHKWKGDSNEFQENETQSSYWNIWTRTITVSENGNLPFREAKEVPVKFDGKTEKLFVLPAQGQLYVSGEEMAKLLNLQSKFYSQSRILEISNDNKELIVKAGSNAAYEDMVKTPMPATALYYKKTVYLPISVIANSFGHSVNWDEKNETITLGGENNEITY